VEQEEIIKQREYKLKKYCLLALLVIWLVLSLYVVKNVEYIKFNPCAACEEATGAHCYQIIESNKVSSLNIEGGNDNGREEEVS